MSSHDPFSFNGLNIVPGNIVAMSAGLPKGVPWLTLLPLSSRHDGAIAYGALPGMRPRAEMFNKLANGVNALNAVRMIIAKVAKVNTKTTETTTALKAPAIILDGNGQEIKVQGLASKSIADSLEEGNIPLSITTTNTSSSLESASSSNYIKSESTVTKGYYHPGDEKKILDLLASKYGEVTEGEYIVSTYSTADVKIEYVNHPLSKISTAHLNLANLSEKKLILEKATEKGSCATERAEVDGGKTVFSQYLGGGIFNQLDIEAANVPKTRVTWSTETRKTKTATVSLKASKEADFYSIPVGFNGEYVGPSCGSYEQVTIKPVLINFSPQILRI